MGKKLSLFPKKIRKFDGKLFRYDSRAGLKRTAQTHAKLMRKKGDKVRVVPYQDWYAIYKR